MNALEVEDFNVLGYPGTDDSVKSLVTAFVKRLRDDEGKYITGVLYQHTSADSIGIISVKNRRQAVRRYRDHRRQGCWRG